MDELLASAATKYGLLGLLGILLMRELIKGGAFTVSFVKRKRNGTNWQGSGKPPVVICPLDQTGAIAKVDSLERHQEDMGKTLTVISTGITETNGKLEQLVQGQREQNNGLAQAIRDVTKTQEELFREMRRIKV